MKRFIEIETVKSDWHRDHKAIVRFSGEPAGWGSRPPEAVVKEVVKHLFHGFTDPATEWHHNSLKSLEETSPGVWEVTVHEPNLD